jgi:hypothetical protein
VFCDEFLRLQLITFEVNGDCEVRDCVGRDLFSDSLMIGDLTRITASTELSNAFVPQITLQVMFSPPLSWAFRS